MAADAMRRFRELHDQLKAQLLDLSQAEQEGEEEGGAEAGAGRAAAAGGVPQLEHLKGGRGGEDGGLTALANRAEHTFQSVSPMHR